MFATVAAPSETTSPWTLRPAALARFGRAAEVALSDEQRRPVSIDAFELGRRRSPHRGLKVLGLVLLAPLWIPAFMIAALLLGIPAMVYVPYRIWRDWEVAERVGVSAGTMVFSMLFVVAFGYVGGLLLAVMLMDTVWPVGNAVVLARSGGDVWLLQQRMPLLVYPQFRNIERFSCDDLSLAGEIDARRVVLSLRAGDEPIEIVVKRGPRLIAGAPEVNAANLRLLVGRPAQLA